MSTTKIKSKHVLGTIQTAERRDPSLLYLLVEAGLPGSKSPLRKISELEIHSSFHFYIRRGERPIYCHWNEHKSDQGLLYASYVPKIKRQSMALSYYTCMGAAAEVQPMQKNAPAVATKSCSRNKNFPYTVICPLCPLKTEWSKPEMLGKVGNLIDKLREFYGFSASIVVTGPSMGGLGSYMVAAKFAEKITAAIPICGGGKKVFARLVANKVPCWFSCSQ